MKEVLVVMAILGCGDDGGQCQALQTVDAGFRSIAACNAASPAVLAKLTDLSYPIVMTRCQKRAEPMVAEAAARPRG